MRFHCTFVFDQETNCFSAICWVLVWFVLIDNVRSSPCMLFQHCEKKTAKDHSEDISLLIFLSHAKIILYTDFLFCRSINLRATMLVALML